MSIFKKKTPTYFLKLTTTYFLVLAIALITFSTAIVVLSAVQTERIILNSNTQTLNQLNSFTDRYLLKKIQFLCDEYFQNPSKYSELDSFFHSFGSLAGNDFRMSTELLEGILKNNSFLQNIYIYNGKFDTLVSPKDGVVFGATDPRNQLNVANTFFSYIQEIQTNFWIPPNNTIVFENKKSILTYVYYVSVDEPNAINRSVNCVIMNINTEDIINFINDIQVTDLQNFMIINNEMKILAHSNDTGLYSSFTERESVHFLKILYSPKGSFRTTLNGEMTYVMWLKSSVNDWRYVYVLSTSRLYRQVLLTTLTIISLAGIMIGLCYLIVRRITKKIYTPIGSIVQNIRENVSSELYSEDEFEMLNNFIQSLSLTKQRSEEVMEKYNTLISDKVLSDLLYGVITEKPEDIIEQLSVCGIDFTQPNYRLLILEFNNAILGALPIHQRETVIFGIIDKISNTIKCARIRTSSSTIALIINYLNLDFNAVIDEIRSIVFQKFFINIYYSRQTNDIKQLDDLYKEAIGVTKYSYVFGFDNVFDVKDLLELEKDNTILSPRDISTVENLILSGNKELFENECNKIFIEVKSEKHSFAYAQNVVMQMFSCLCRIARSQNIPIENVDAFEKVIKNELFDDCTLHLFEIADTFFEKYKHKENYQSQVFVSKIAAYISENISDNLSLISVAEHFNISAGYLSKFFKENMNTHFSKFVIDKKFEMAASLLVNEPQTSVSDIACQLGYFDTAYFSRQFKQRYGMTPTHYRKTKALN